MQKSIGLDGKIDGWVDGDKKGFDRKKRPKLNNKKTVITCLGICTKWELIYTVKLQSLLFCAKSIVLDGW